MSEKDCQICQILATNDDVVLEETDRWRVALAPKPRSLGHSFLTSRAHKGAFSKLDEIDLDEYIELKTRMNN